MNQQIQGRRHFIKQVSLAGIGAVVYRSEKSSADIFKIIQNTKSGKRIGIIGLDTSHSTEFVKALNNPNADALFLGYKVVAAYPYGSRSIKSSMDRIPAYTEEVKKAGVEIVDSIDKLLNTTDVILLETNDGNPHLEQALQVIKAGKTVFIDKPVAASLKDVITIYKTAKQANVPLFSSSSLRYTTITQQIAAGKTIGRVLGADSYSPCEFEPSHPDFFWYGIHGIEQLYTVMGKGCVSVSRTEVGKSHVVTGIWDGDRIGTFRGLQQGKAGYGGTAFGETGITALGGYDGYNMLLQQVINFFEKGIAPIAAEETIEIYAFMEAADESKRQGGKSISIKETLLNASR
ncbi:MAG: Gfo/Idh/MocA family oxidoreductase [Agriterribacter sp.]